MSISSSIYRRTLSEGCVCRPLLKVRQIHISRSYRSLTQCNLFTLIYGKEITSINPVRTRNNYTTFFLFCKPEHHTSIGTETLFSTHQLTPVALSHGLLLKYKSPAVEIMGYHRLNLKCPVKI